MADRGITDRLAREEREAIQRMLREIFESKDSDEN